MNTALRNTFSLIGLGEKQQRLMEVLLGHGPMIASRIAKEAGLNRSTCYGLLKELIEKGLVSTTKKGTLRYQSIDPKLLPDYLARQREQLKVQEEELKEILPQLILQREKAAFLPKVQFFEGVEGVKQAYEDTLENNEGKMLYNMTGVEAVWKVMGQEWTNYYLQKRSRLGIRCKNISPDSAETRAGKELDEKWLRVTKLLPAKFNFETEVDIYDNKVGIFSFAKENPVAILIEDEAIAHTLKTLFDYIDEKTA